MMLQWPCRPGGAKFLFLIFNFCLLIFGLPLRAWAQVESGTIVGTVTDPTGAAVPNVKVTLVNSATSFRRVAVANANGQYVAYSVPTGQYSVTVAELGFERLVRQGVQLSAAETVTVDLKLAVGNVQQTVEVRDTVPLVQDQSATVSELVTNKQVEEMPLNGRMFTQLVLLSPGTVSGSAGALDPGNPYSIRGSANITVNGTSPQMQSFLVDGIFNRSLWVGSLLMVPAIDSIQEVRVQTSSYSAQYGASAGGVTIIQTKSGSNLVHGSAYEFLRNEKMDANQFFNNSLGAPKPAYRRNQFGGTVGGPIRRDKIFYFMDYEGNRIRQPQNVVSTIPTLAQQTMVATGDFSGLGTGIFDPYSIAASGARNPFPGNTIPASRLDPAALKFFQLLPAPVNGGATQNFVFNPEQTLTRDQMDARLDDNLGPANRLFLKYSFDNTNAANPGTLPAPARATVPIGPYLADSGNATNAISIPLFTQSGTGNYTWVISPVTLNEVRAAFLRWNLDITPLGNAYDTAAALGIPGINISNRAGGLPAFTITGLQVLGDSSSYPEDSHTTTFNFEDVVTLIRGSHTVTLGGLVLRHRFNGFSSFPTRGAYDFNGQFTRQINGSGSRTTIADYALGVPDAVSRMILTSEFGMRLWNLTGYTEDSWRVTARLTFNYGLRYEIFAPPYDVHNHFANIDLKTALLEIAGRNGNSRSLRNLDLKDFAPRLGLAYALTGDRRTVFRSGFGISYNDTIAAGNQLYKNLPYDFNQVISTDQNGVPPLRLSDGLPTPVPPDINNIAALSTGSPITWDSNMKILRVIQWSAGVQHELARSLLLDLTYVGTRSNRIVSPVNINQPYPGPGAVNPRRPYYAINPNIGDIKLYSNSGNGDYHGLQFRVEKRYAQGLTGSLAYSFSKYLSDTQNISGSGNGPPQDARCIRCEWGSMPEDRRQILVVNHAYELPFGPGRRYLTSGLLSYIGGNWNLSGIWTAETGGHFPTTLASAVSNSTGGGAARPNRVGNGNLPPDQRTLNQWFNIAAFVTPAQYTFGNSGQGILEGPGLFNVDLGIHRIFRLRERLALTYRWEMFNSFNRVNFSNPNASIGNPQAGQISGTGPARVMQMALRLAW
jgi:hypothetical protein